GIIAQTFQTSYRANEVCQLGYNINVLYGLNEIFWFINEAAVSLYSFCKAESVTYIILPKYLNVTLRCFFSLFVTANAGVRAYSGYIRGTHGKFWDDDIATAVGYSYIPSALTDSVVLGMLIVAGSRYMRAEKSTSIAINIVLKSSILRLIVMNVSQVLIASNLFVSNRTQLMIDYLRVLWLIRSTFTMILLYDIQSTHSLLIVSSVKAHNNHKFMAGLENNTYKDVSDEEILKYERSIKAEESGKPLVSSVTSFDAILSEYENASVVFTSKLKSLIELHSGLRSIRKDGNCFYRAFGFCFSELVHQNPQWRNAAIARASQTKDLLSDTGYDISILEDFWKPFADALKPESNFESSFTTEYISDTIVCYLRLATAAELKKNRDLYEAFVLDSYPSLDIFIGSQVEP
ncbi:OTU domain, ubiquitin aldehyde binding, partial [Nowakowskiella sp. JEL0078]